MTIAAGTRLGPYEIAELAIDQINIVLNWLQELKERVPVP
jgi:hypothetical protein